MRAKVSVQAEQIVIAQRGVLTRCAIVAAIMSQVPASRYVKVTRETISWLDVDRQERLIFRTPPKAVAFIEAWDAGEAVSPLEFSLTDTALIERRSPRRVATRTRVQRPSSQPTQNPGSRMTRS